MKGISLKQAGVLVLLLFGLVLAFAPFDNPTARHLDARMVAQSVQTREDHITAEQLGQMIIDKDPGYQLIDISAKEDYDKFHIPTAVNIPMDQLFSEEILSDLSHEKLLVLCSNGGTHAAQAWVLLHQLGFKNAVVLLGGLNYWIDVYTNPAPPEDAYADSEIFRYQFLISAGKVLTGDVIPGDQKVQSDADLPKIEIPVIKKKKKRGDEGC